METSWIDKNEYPFNSHFFELDRVKMHYLDEGQGETVLFVHGTPSWSFDFRKVIKACSKDFRCLAIDHIGFGLSDKPSDYQYSMQIHASNLEEFILKKINDSFHLVVHDFGGPIALSFAVKYPEKVKSITIINSWVWDLMDHPEYKKPKKLLKSPLVPLLYRWFNFSPKVILPKSFGDKTKLTKHIHDHYLKPFPTIKDREGMLAFARALIQETKWFDDLSSRMTILKSKNVLFLWGMKDAFVLPFNLEKFESYFDNSETIKLEDCGHFPQEEEARTPVLIHAFLLANKEKTIQ